MSGIKYTNANQGGGIVIQSLRGVVPGSAFNTLSSSPFAIIPANTLPAQRTFVPISFTIRMSFATAGLSSPAQFTFLSSSTFPFFEFQPRVAGAQWITCSPIFSFTTFGQTEFNENNLPDTNFPLVLSSNTNSPAANFEDAPYELLYTLIQPLL